MHQQDIAGVEQFDLGLGTCGVDDFRHFSHIGRRINHHLGTEGHGVEIERRDIRPQHRNMLGALGWSKKQRARACNLRIILTVRNDHQAQL
jgi:hypothetical protein